MATHSTVFTVSLLAQAIRHAITIAVVALVTPSQKPQPLQSNGYTVGGLTSGGTTSVSLGSMTTTCASNSSYSLQGWATSSSSTTVRYSSAKDAYEDGYTTIYGVYRKSASSSNSTCYYYRGSGTRNSVTKTTTTAGSLLLRNRSAQRGRDLNLLWKHDHHLRQRQQLFFGWVGNLLQHHVYLIFFGQLGV